MDKLTPLLEISRNPYYYYNSAKGLTDSHHKTKKNFNEAFPGILWPRFVEYPEYVIATGSTIRKPRNPVMTAAVVYVFKANVVGRIGEIYDMRRSGVTRGDRPW